ncbi:MAG: hypothetical protein QMD17_09715 [Rhodocyclaceae bacterium]|nr:hypothetical protein [Rhodocyclaceae bacterium]
MLVALVTLVVLIAAVGAIYFLLKSMGQDGVEVAAPGSCKSGRCGVPRSTAIAASCRQEGDQFGEADELKGIAAPDRQHAVEEQQSRRLG